MTDFGRSVEPSAQRGPRLPLVVLSCLLLCTGCSREDPPSTATSGEEPLQITRDFTTTESDSGQVRYAFHAEVARLYPGNVTRAEAIRVEFYDKGERVSVLTARRGVLEGGRITVIGDVVVVSDEGARLETDSLYWDPKKKKICSDVFVRITRERDATVLTGSGLSSDPDLVLVDIKDPEVSGPGDPGRR
ncbi:MAG: LPS export ABC transporter periplasmic protein LptC [Candidatus Krumholzibacteriia bacterium]